MKRSLLFCFCLLLSAICFAQRGGGGGFGGGGGNRGGGNRGNAAAAWGSAAYNDTVPMMRQGGTLFWDNGRNSAVREDDLKEALGDEQFEAYETANRLFIKGDNRQSVGVLLYIPAAVFGVMSFAKKDNDANMSRNMAFIAGGLTVPATAFMIWGGITKKKAKLDVDNIASDYNIKVEKRKSDRKAATLSLLPSVMFDRATYDLAPGAGLRLSF